MRSTRRGKYDEFDHRRRPLHPAPSRPSRHRLCLLSEGARLLRADRRCRPRPEDDAAGDADAAAKWCGAFPIRNTRRDARLKIDLARDHLAGKEMEIGRWYESQGSYLAAINRFRRVVDDYQTTTHVPEALHRLTECYLALGPHRRGGADRLGARLQLSRQRLVQRQLRAAQDRRAHCLRQGDRRGKDRRGAAAGAAQRARTRARARASSAACSAR